MKNSNQTIKLNFNTIPNFVTLTRAILAPVGLGVLLINTIEAYVLCIIIMLLAELTDFLDGYIARKIAMTSDVGKLLDPLCDSLYRLMIFIGFVGIGWMPVWMLAIFVSRDIIVAYVRVFAALHKVVFHARLSGKIKAVAQGVAQFGTLSLYILYSLNFLKTQPTVFVFTLLLVTALITAYSGIDYIIKAYIAVKNEDIS